MDANVKMNELLEKASTDRRVLNHLKHASVRAQSYEFAAYLREIEKEKFPESPEDKDAKEKAKLIDLVLRMVEIGVKESTAYRIYEALRIFGKKKGKFDMKDASKIIADSDRIFNDD